jgi:hypothetical protein
MLGDFNVLNLNFIKLADIISKYRQVILNIL